MSDLLLILNPRRIDECVDALQELDIDRLWIRRMTEAEIAGRWGEIMDGTAGYRRLIIVGDDAIVRPHALAAVQELLDEGHPVVTGYSNLAADDWRANLASEPLRGDLPHPDAYTFYTVAEALAWPDKAIPTYVSGFTLLGMNRTMWNRYPFQVTGYGGQSDYHLSKRLYADGVPIVAAREGFCLHVKERWNHGDQEARKRLLVGVEPAELILDARVPVTA